MRILLVDDDEDSRRLFETVLRRAGHEVTLASDGDEALLEAARNQPDLVLSDILMPRVDGYSLCRVFKREPSLQDIPIVLYTGVYKGKADEETALRMGAAAFVAKPVEPTTLLEVVERAAGHVSPPPVFGEHPHEPIHKPVLGSYDVRLIHQMERRAEEMIRLHEPLLLEKRLSDAILENVPAGIALLDPQFVLLRCNRAFEDHLGACAVRNAAHAIGKSYFDLVPGGRDQVEPMFRRIAGSGRPEGSGSLRLVPPGPGDGRETFWDFSLAPLMDPDGRVEGVILILLDASERKRSEEALFASREMLQLVLNTIPQRVFWKDRASKYLGCNSLFASDVGLSSPVDIAGKTDFDLAWKDTAPLLRADDAKIMAEDAPMLGSEGVRSRPDGSQLWVLASKVPLHDDRGKVIGVLGTYEDITEQRQMREALRMSEASLTRARAFETIGILAQGIAHEVRNPLFAIEVNVSAMVRELGSHPEILPFLENVHEHVRRLDVLMRDLLELGRPLAETEFLECSVHDVLLKAITDVEDTTPGSRARVSMDASPASARINAAPARLTQAFAHLLANAFQNSPPQGRVFISLSEGPGEVSVSIRDEGAGIAETVKESLFRPFVTTHAGRKGLGLALARHYLEAHGGSLRAANNDPPPGATFTVSLPTGGTVNGTG